MPDLSQLWQRFLLASSLIVGLAIGVAATVFGYSNLGTVNVHWSVFHVDGVPLWTVAVLPLALFTIAGTLYHWVDGLHHFTEHMRHRRRVHELEAEVASLRLHLDHVLEMPDQSTSKLSEKRTTTASLPAADDRMADLDDADASDVASRKPEPTDVEPVKSPDPVKPKPEAAKPSPNKAASKRPAGSRKGRSGPRKRATLTALSAPAGDGRSGSAAEVVAGAVASAAQAERPAEEA